jgi:CheY-like chemotaxis protein
LSTDENTFEILVVDDDKENIDQLKKLLPGTVGTAPVVWEYTDSFDDALAMLKRRRFDVLISDIYRGRDKGQKTIAEGDVRARGLVDEIRERRFCPIVLFTDGQVPEDLVNRPFVWSADKGATDFDRKLLALIEEAISTGLPEVARRLHDELDKYAGSYVWRFLADRWDDLRKKDGFDTAALERIIRRRAAIHLARVDGSGDDVTARAAIDPVDYYIYPPISKFIRLGEIIKRKGTSEFRVVLTPHCFLVVQPGEDVPRAAHVLTALTIPANDMRGDWKWAAKEDRIADELRKRTAFPASDVGRPSGRYCFLPGFLDIPDLYCDLMQIESLGFKTVIDDFERVAVLDWPFAEALQACITALYGTVGVPLLSGERVKHLRPEPQQPAAPAAG